MFDYDEMFADGLSYRDWVRRNHRRGGGRLAPGQVRAATGMTREQVRYCLDTMEGGRQSGGQSGGTGAGRDVETTVVLSDVHIPSEDPEAVRVALDFIAWLKPTTLVLNGDILDVYQLSRFDRDPGRSLEIQDDLNKMYDFFRRVRKAAPNAEIHYCEGNHERRLKTYLMKHPEIAGLSVLEPQSLFRLGEYGIEWHPVEETWRHHGFVITHGTTVRRHAGRSAQGEFERYGCSGISGHVHRLGAYSRTTLDATYTWLEGGCLARLDPEYMVGPCDWQQGIVVGHYHRGEDRFAAETVPIVSGRIHYQGRTWG